MLTVTSPFVAILPYHGAKAASTVPELFGVTGAKAMPLLEAVEESWDTDAHVATCYAARGEGATRVLGFGRVLKHPDVDHPNRVHLKSLRDQGVQVWCSALLFDWDNEDHAEWPNAEDATRSLHTMVDGLTALGIAPTVCYTTRAGLRIIWVFEKHVLPEVYEHLAAGMWMRLYEAGLRCDHRVFDWTRIMRLPRVVRDGKALDQEPWFALHKDHCVLLEHAVTPRDPHEIRAIAEGTRRPGLPSGKAVRVGSVGAMPDPVDAYQLAWAGHRAPHPWAQQVRAWLPGDLRDRLYVSRRPYAAGSRNSSLLSAIGALVSAGVRTEGASPEGIFGLLTPVLEQMDPDKDTPNWFICAWSMVQRFWPLEESKVVADEEVKQERKVGLLEALREVYPENKAVADEQLEMWVQQHVIVSLSLNECFTLEDDGEYSPYPMQWDAAVRRTLSSPVISPYCQHLLGKDGEPLFEPKHHTKLRFPAQRVRYRSWGHSRIDYDKFQGWTLTLKCHTIDESVEPVYNHLVEVWLRELAGKTWALFERYICSVTNTRYPTAALSLHGPKQTGKSLLAGALAWLFTGKAPVRDYGVSQYQAQQVLQSPIFLYDEAKPQGQTVKRMDALLREMVVGGKLLLDEKYRARMEVEIYPRFIFTANNEHLVSGLLGWEDTTRHDAEALAERVIAIRVQQGAAAAMRRLQAAHRAELVEVVAVHLRWMQAQIAPWVPIDRFLVSGEAESTSLLSRAALRSDQAQITLIALVALLELEAIPVPNGIEGDTFYVCVGYLAKRLEANKRTTLTHNALANMLQLVDPGARQTRYGARRVWALKLGTVVQTLIDQDIDIAPSVDVLSSLRAHAPDLHHYFAG